MVKLEGQGQLQRRLDDEALRKFMLRMSRERRIPITAH